MYCIVLYCNVLYCTVLYCDVLHSSVLFCIVPYCIVLYCTVLYNRPGPQSLGPAPRPLGPWGLRLLDPIGPSAPRLFGPVRICPSASQFNRLAYMYLVIVNPIFKRYPHFTPSDQPSNGSWILGPGSWVLNPDHTQTTHLLISDSQIS